MSFLPEGYQLPKAGGQFFKFEEGKNTIQILTPAFVHMEGWDDDNKPHRWPAGEQKAGNWSRPPKEVWAVLVFAKGHGVRVLGIGQMQIMEALATIAAHGDIVGKWFDIIKSGTGLQTKYVVMPNPYTETLTPEQHQDCNYAVANVNWQNYLDGGTAIIEQPAGYVKP